MGERPYIYQIESDYTLYLFFISFKISLSVNRVSTFLSLILISTIAYVLININVLR